MNNDHRIADQPLAYRGYQAFAPTTILTRLLANYSEVGLSDEQIRALLDIKRRYRSYLVEQWPKLVNNWTALDRATNAWKINEERCEKLIVERSALMTELDSFFTKACIEINSVLSSKQHKRLAELYEQEKITYFERIRVPLRHKFESAMSILK